MRIDELVFLFVYKNYKQIKKKYKVLVGGTTSY